jgi:demethylmenaquinone methyltransferase/2-methoxy-6-polyprenyl-1,4-benzoquinol methylase
VDRDGGRVTDLSKSPSRIAGMFDAIAGRYDVLNHLLSANLDRGWRRRAIASLHLTGCERVLDLCTGTADVALAAGTASPPAARVIGVDFAAAMLRVGLGKVAQRGLQDRITLVRADATRIPVVDASVDAVTTAFGIRNVEHVEVACREMFRVLTPRGRVAILEFAVPQTPGFRQAYRWYLNRVLPRLGRVVSGNAVAYQYLPDSVGAFAKPEELVTLLRQAGFLEVRAVPLTFGAVYLYTAKK